MQKVINCPCGAVIEAENENDLVARAQDHAKRVHQMELTQEQALSMATPKA